MRTREHAYLLTKRIHTLAVTFDEIVTHTVHARKETVNAQVCRRLQSRNEEIVHKKGRRAEDHRALTII